MKERRDRYNIKKSIKGSIIKRSNSRNISWKYFDESFKVKEKNPRNKRRSPRNKRPYKRLEFELFRRRIKLKSLSFLEVFQRYWVEIWEIDKDNEEILCYFKDFNGNKALIGQLDKYKITSTSRFSVDVALVVENGKDDQVEEDIKVECLFYHIPVVKKVKLIQAIASGENFSDVIKDRYVRDPKKFWYKRK